VVSPGTAAAGGPDVLAAKCAALGRRIATRVHAGDDGRGRPALLAVVDPGEARPVPGADVQGAIWAEREVPDRVAGELLAPVLDEDLLRPDDRRTVDREARQPGADDAAVGGRPGRVRASVAPARRVRRRAEDVVVGVQDIHVRAVAAGAVGDGRVEGHAEEAPIPVVVHVRLEVGVDRRGGVGQVVEDLDHAALLGDEHTAVCGKAQDRRVREAGPDRGLLEAGGDGLRDGRAAGARVGGGGAPVSDLWRRLLEKPLLAALARLGGLYGSRHRGTAERGGEGRNNGERGGADLTGARLSPAQSGIAPSWAGVPAWVGDPRRPVPSPASTIGGARGPVQGFRR